MPKILVVDDEKSIVKGIHFSLLQEGWEVEEAYDGETGLEMAGKTAYDTVILDLMLPKMGGLEVCRRIREFSDMPIIMLTAKGESTDKITGLDCGADDYMTKPFDVQELKARIRANLRRLANKQALLKIQEAPVEELRLDPENHRVFVKNREINVTAREFEVLALLKANPNKVYSREQLLKLVWNLTCPGDARTVDVHVRRLREKIEENPAKPRFICTKWGVGYYYKNEKDL